MITSTSPSLSHFSYTQDWQDLSKIHQARQNLIIVQRKLSPDLKCFLYSLQKTSYVPVIEELIPIHRLKRSMKEYFAPFHKLNLHGYQEFIEDIYQLAQCFSSVTGQTVVKIFFAKITSSMCRLFHTDANELRMLCTYWGPGTQWVEDDNIQIPPTSFATNEGRIRDLSQVRKVATGNVVLMKGALHDQIDNNALMHRSPPLDKDECRLLLRLDMENAF